MKQWWRERRPYILSGIIYAVARLIWATLRVRVINVADVERLQGEGKTQDRRQETSDPSPATQPALSLSKGDGSQGKIYCGWHGHSLIPALYFRNQGQWVIISHSRDGEMQTRIFTKLGYNIIRGSTGRGGARALIESIRVLRNGATMAITPDGPRGPSGVVQEGIMMMAQKSGCALIPVGTYARPAWFAPTWDRYMVPWLFARAIFIVGDPLYVAENSSPKEVEAIKLKLQEEIHRLQALAKERV